jgi:hypothetical protein
VVGSEPRPWRGRNGRGGEVPSTAAADDDDDDADDDDAALTASQQPTEATDPPRAHMCRATTSGGQ